MTSRSTQIAPLHDQDFLEQGSLNHNSSAMELNAAVNQTFPCGEAKGIQRSLLKNTQTVSNIDVYGEQQSPSDRSAFNKQLDRNVSCLNRCSDVGEQSWLHESLMRGKTGLLDSQKFPAMGEVLHARSAFSSQLVSYPNGPDALSCRNLDPSESLNFHYLEKKHIADEVDFTNYLSPVFNNVPLDPFSGPTYDPFLLSNQCFEPCGMYR